jgi:hypothetical protein
MFTHILAASLTLQGVLQRSFRADPGLAHMFDPAQSGNANVSLATPDDMEAAGDIGISMWLYRLIRDEQTLNQPPRHMTPNLIRREPLPLRAHYLMTPIITGKADKPAPEAEQLIGRVLQTFHDEPLISGPDLAGSYEGPAVELAVRPETLGLDETGRIWKGPERSYQLSISYEVAIVVIGSARADLCAARRGGHAAIRNRRTRPRRPLLPCEQPGQLQRAVRRELRYADADRIRHAAILYRHGPQSQTFHGPLEGRFV